MALQPEEEVLRGRLESLAVQLSLPTQFKVSNNIVNNIKMKKP